MKKKINSVSKNLEIAKKDWSENMLQSSQKEKEREKGKNVNRYNTDSFQTKTRISNSNIRPATFTNNRERSTSAKANKIRKSTQNTNKTMHVKQKSMNNLHKNMTGFPTNIFDANINKVDNNFQSPNEDDNEIQFVRNPVEIKIISTKVETKIEKTKSNLGNLNRTNFLLDDELNEKMRILEEKLLNKKEGTVDDKFGELLHSNQNNQYKHDEAEDITELNEDLKRKFNGLTDLEEGMKKLNEILDFSSKSSLKFKFETENKSIDKDENSDRQDKFNNLEEKFNKMLGFNQTSNFKLDSYSNQNLQNPNSNSNYTKLSKPQQNKSSSNFVTATMGDKSDVIGNTLEKQKNFAMTNKYSLYNNNELQEPTPYEKISPSVDKSVNPPKRVEIQRKVIDVDKSRVGQSCAYDNYDKEEESELDYLKNLLMKTKSELDKFNKKFDEEDVIGEVKNVDDDEDIKPRAPPHYMSGYQKN